MLKFSHFGWGYLPYIGFGSDLHALNNILSSIDNVSFKNNSMSLGLVVLEKLFMQTGTLMPQLDAIMSADIKSVFFKTGKYKCRISVGF